MLNTRMTGMAKQDMLPRLAVNSSNADSLCPASHWGLDSDPIRIPIPNTYTYLHAHNNHDLVSSSHRS